jgi:hypothetical protein
VRGAARRRLTGGGPLWAKRAQEEAERGRCGPRAGQGGFKSWTVAGREPDRCPFESEASAAAGRESAPRAEYAWHGTATTTTTPPQSRRRAPWALGRASVWLTACCWRRWAIAVALLQALGLGGFLLFTPWAGRERRGGAGGRERRGGAGGQRWGRGEAEGWWWWGGGGGWEAPVGGGRRPC